jgi:hypothetical protein
VKNTKLSISIVSRYVENRCIPADEFPPNQFLCLSSVKKRAIYQSTEYSTRVTFCTFFALRSITFLILTIRPDVISVAYSTFVVEVYMAYLALIKIHGNI